VAVIRLSETLTFWTAPHPAWTPNPEWPEDVGFVVWEAPDTLVLIDPLVRADGGTDAWDSLDRVVSGKNAPVVVLLTCPWHVRSTRAVAERYGARVWIHPLGRDRVAGLPELDSLPHGVETFLPRGVDEGQVAFTILPGKTLVVAEFFLGTNDGLRVAPSPATRNMAEFIASLDELRHRPIDRVLVAHGLPVLADGSRAISAALDAFRAGHSF